GFGRCSNNPDVTFFQLLYQSNEICDASDGNILECTGCNFGNHARQSDRASLRDKDTMNTRTLCRPHNRTHVAWILESIEPEHEGRIGRSHFRRELIQQTFRISVTSGRDARHHSLMSGVAECSIEIEARYTMDRHSFFSRELEQRLQTIWSRAFEDRDRFDLAFAGTQRLEHGVWTIDNI